MTLYSVIARAVRLVAISRSLCHPECNEGSPQTTRYPPSLRGLEQAVAISSLAMRYQRGLSLVGFEEILHCVAAKEEIKEFKEIKEVKAGPP